MVVIVEDDGKLIWGTHYVSVGLGYPCTGVRIVVAGGMKCMVGKWTMPEGGEKCRRHGFKGSFEETFKSRGIKIEG